MTRELIAGACPDPQMLSAYLDGKLDPTERGRIEDHISRCEDCYFVVRETALVWSEVGTEATPPAETQRETPGGGEVVRATFGDAAATPAASAAVEAPVADPRRPKASSFARYLMPIAATLVVAAGALALWRQGQANHDPRAGMVAAVGERRFFEARLTGGFRHGPMVSPKRGGPPPPSNELSARAPAASDWEVLGAAAKARDLIGVPKSTEGRAALASAHLLLGEVDDAIRLLERAIADSADSSEEGERKARLLSDLSAAYLTRAASQDRADDYPLALENATNAVEVSPRLPEALYNRALALESLHLKEQAIAAWEAFLAIESDPGWSGDAARRLEALRALPNPRATSQAATPPRSAYWERFVSATTAERRSAVRAEMAATADESVSRAHDSMDRESLDRLDRVRSPELALAHLKFTRAVEAYEVRGRLREALPDWEAARAVFLKHGSPMSNWADFYVAVARYYEGGISESHAAFKRLASDRFRRYPSLQGQALWMIGLTNVVQGRPGLAEASYEQASELFREIDDEDSLSAIESLRATNAWRLGQFGLGWERMRSALDGLGAVVPRRRHIALFNAAYWLHGGGLHRAAAAFDHAVSANAIRSDRLDWRVEGLHLEARGALSAGNLAVVRDRTHRVLSLLPGLADPILRDRVRARSLAVIASTRVSARDAIADLNEALSLLERQQSEPLRAEVLAGLVRRHREIRDFESASIFLEQAIEVHDAARRSGVVDAYRVGAFARAFDLATEVANLAIERGDPALGLVGVDGLRAREARLDGTRTRLSITALPHDVLFIEYVVAEDGLLVWGILNGETRFSRVSISNRALAALVEDHIGNLQRADLTSWSVSGKSLRRLLLPTEIEPWLRAAKRLVCVPDGPLFAIPFASLGGTEPGGLLVDLLPTIVTPSIGYYLEQLAVQTSKRSRDGLFAVGDPDASRLGFVRLPRAAEEVRAIATTLPGGTTLLGPNARRNAVLNGIGRARVFHFSGHATSPRSNLGGAEPALVLATTDGEEDPFLRASDPEWRAAKGLYLAILASCSTARGDFQGGEGPQSLARSLLRHGTRSVIASLWPIDDATESFFLGLYTELVAGVGSVEALWRVQRKYGRTNPRLAMSFQIFGSEAFLNHPTRSLIGDTDG